jgi:hypothetical protein
MIAVHLDPPVDVVQPNNYTHSDFDRHLSNMAANRYEGTDLQKFCDTPTFDEKEQCRVNMEFGCCSMEDMRAEENYSVQHYQPGSSTWRMGKLPR